MKEFGNDWDCRKAVRVSMRMALTGLAMLPLGIAVGAMANSSVLMCFIAAVGTVLMISGYVLNLRGAVCPRCGSFLGNLPRMAGKTPNYCPNCGKPL